MSKAHKLPELIHNYDTKLPTNLLDDLRQLQWHILRKSHEWIKKKASSLMRNLMV
jgi:hypothetical protein